MNQRLLSVLAFAFIVSAGASLLLYRLLSGRMPAQPAPGRTKLVLAARNLDPGTLIRDADIRESDWNGTVPAGILHKREEITGRGVISPIMAYEPFVDSRLAPKGGGAGLAALIPNGMRAVAIRVNEIVGVAGFVVPGMRVDVLVSGSPPGGSSVGSLTKTLLQNVEVLSAGQNFQKDAEGKPVSVQVVNLLVTPEQAERLCLASNQTTIQLVLRNPLDTQIAKTPGTALAQIFHPETPLAGNAGGSPVPVVRPLPTTFSVAPPLPKRSPDRIVEVFHGAKRTDVDFAARPEVRP